jgi:anti-anti-sigma factor
VPIDPQSRRPGFQTTIAEDGSVSIAIRGDLDVTTLAALAEQLARLADVRPTRLVIDMSGVSFLDCASARLLASTATFLPSGQEPVLSSAQPIVRRLLEVSGLAAIIEIVG